MKYYLLQGVEFPDEPYVSLTNDFAHSVLRAQQGPLPHTNKSKLSPAAACRRRLRRNARIRPGLRRRSLRSRASIVPPDRPAVEPTVRDHRGAPYGLFHGRDSIWLDAPELGDRLARAVALRPRSAEGNLVRTYSRSPVDDIRIIAVGSAAHSVALRMARIDQPMEVIEVVAVWRLGAIKGEGSQQIVVFERRLDRAALRLRDTLAAPVQRRPQYFFGRTKRQAVESPRPRTGLLRETGQACAWSAHR